MSRYIDADKMIENTKAMRSLADAIAIDGIIKHIEDNIVPDVEQVKHGEWKPIERLWEYSHQWQCTKCENPVLTDRYLYCPNCGAKMDGKEQ